MSRIARGLRTAALAAVLALGLGGLTACDNPFSDDGPGAAPSPTAPAASIKAEIAEPLASQFTRDGTFQSHIRRGPLDFVYTVYPTKATPRTNEWYPRGRKYFTFTFQAYDLSRSLRAPFATKRLVYLDRISVDSRTIRSGKGRPERPYRLDAVARRITFDPEPPTTRYGMLITSPKGAFELRNQVIRPTASDTRGVVLRFRAVVYAETSAGSGRFRREIIEQRVPMGIFASDKATVAASIPRDAN
ncbi:hypothetical protein GCM10022215_11500 [Nocardioides fonticola]|uniref:Uncharacterized protein n=1 Tax=Nocardioides fonticola TaxID=450363 RepID=A0ABP7XEQ5_9ACTN